MDSKFDNYLEANRDNFVRYNPVFLKSLFGSTDVLPFWVADADFQVMPKLIEKLTERAEQGLFGYETKSLDLKKALSSWYDHRYDIKINARKLLFIPTVNASIAAIIDELSEPGDGIIIQPPVYQAFKSIIDGLGRETIDNPLVYTDNHYQVDFDDFRAKAEKPSNKIFLLCSPHNPVGRVWTKEELMQMAQICTENNVLIIADEIHGDIVYSPNKYIGMLSIQKQLNDDNIIMVSSAGKSFAMPGLIDSFIYTPNAGYHQALKERIAKFHLDKSNAFANTAWQVVYEHGGNWIDEMTKYLKGNIDYITSFLNEHLPQIRLPKPEGTYQIWLDFRKLKLTDDQLAKFLSLEAKIALNEGHTYGPGGGGFARMNIASPRAMIEKGMLQLKDAVDRLQ